MARPKAPKPTKNPEIDRGKKSLSWREDPEILRRLPDVEALVLACYPNTTIAEKLGVSEATIRRDRDRIAELWKETALGEIEEKRGRSISNLRRLQRLAAEEFDNKADKVANLRVQLDAEKVIIGLEGTTTPVEQTVNLKGDRPLEALSSAELLRRATALDEMARKLLEK